MPSELWTFSLLSAVSALVCFQKGKPAFGWLGLLGVIPPLTVVLGPIAAIGALRIAKPGSSWATSRYGPGEMQKARERFPNVDPIPTERPAPETTVSQRVEEPSGGDHTADIREFLYEAWARGLIDDETQQRLLGLLRGEPTATALGGEEKTTPSTTPPPVAETTTPPTTWEDFPPSQTVPIAGDQTAPVVEPAPKPLPSPPPPPLKPPEPSPLAATLSRVWEAVLSDVALHGFSYLGVLLTFVGVLGFLLFAFADIPDVAQPFIELFIAMIFFGWAWVLRRQDAEHVADGMELIGGMVLPLILFAGLVDNAPIPPDFQNGALVAALTVTTILLAVAYSWFTSAHSDSILRYLVAPLLWLGALVVGFLFKHDEVLASTAITRLVSEQPALASAAIAITILVARGRLQHRLAIPTVRSSLLGLPVAYLLTIALSVGEGWTRTWPVVLLGAATYVSAGVLIGIYNKQSWGVWLRPVLLAGVLGPIGPVLGWGWLGLLVALGYVALFEQARRGVPGRLEAELLPAIGILAGAVLSLLEPWAALITFTGLSGWAHYRRHISQDEPRVEYAFAAAAAVFPVGVGHALTRILDPAVAWMVMAVILAVLTAVLRWRRNDDVFWPYWLAGAAMLVALGSLVVWVGGGQAEAWGPATTAIVAGVVGLGRGRPIARLWAAAGLASAAVAMALEVAQFSLDQRVVVWSGIGLGATALATVLRRIPLSHLAAIGHIIATGAIATFPTGAVLAAALGGWSVGWILSVITQETDGDSVAGLLGRALAAAGLGGVDRATEFARWIPPTLMVIGIPIAAINAANLSETFAANRSWTGVVMGTVALAYSLMVRRRSSGGVSPALDAPGGVENARRTSPGATALFSLPDDVDDSETPSPYFNDAPLVSRSLRGRRPLRTVLATAAVVSSIIGVAVTAPEPWPTIYATAVVIAVATLLTDELRQTWFVWFAWLMSIVIVLLLAERAGVPAGSLHLAGLLWGTVMLIGGLILDDAMSGRRSPGEGLRITWTRHPVLLGALLTPIGAAPLFANPPDIYGWWAGALGVVYLVVAWLIRAGAVTAAGFALLAVAMTALSPRSPLEDPPLFIFVAAPLVGLAWIARRVQSPQVGSDWWLRWDIGPLLVAHLVGGLAILMAIGTDSMIVTALVFGLLSLLLGLWLDHRVWIDAGNLLLLASAFASGAGWFALALGGTSLRGMLGARLTTGVPRASYQVMGLGAAALGWVALLDWLDLAGLDAVNTTAPVFAGLGVLTGLLSQRGLIRYDTVMGWGGLGVAGAVVSALVAISPGGPGVEGPWLAVGFLLTAIAAEISAEKTGPALQVVSVVSAGIAWILLIAGLGWSSVERINYSALVFSSLAFGIAVLSRFISLRRMDIARWGGLGAAGVLFASLASLAPAGEAALDQPWIAVGLAGLTVALQLSAKWFGPTLANLAVAAAGLAWLALLPATGWTVVESVNNSALVFASLALVTGLSSRFWHAGRTASARWVGFGVAGVVLSAAATQSGLGRPALEQPWIGLSLAIVAVSAELAWRSIGPALRYLTVTGAGLAWLALLPSTGWAVSTGVAVTAVVFGGLVVVVVELSRLFLESNTVEPEPALNLARAWAGLGAGFVVGAAFVAEMTTVWPQGPYWVVGCLGLLGFAAVRAAAPLRVAGLREIAMVIALAALSRLAQAAAWPDAVFASGVVVLAATATSGALGLWRRSPQSVWIRPVFVLASLANLEALLLALGAWPQRSLLVAVVLSLGGQGIAVGLIRNVPGLVATGPPLVGLGFILAIAGNVSGTAQWYTIPIAIVLLSEVEILRWIRRDARGVTARQDTLVLEWTGVGLLAAPSLVETFTTDLAYGWTALVVAVAVMVWGIVTRVRRRFVASASLAITTSVLMVVAATAARAPGSAFFWILAAGIGFAVMMVVAFVEAYRSRKGHVMARLGQLMEGWE